VTVQSDDSFSTTVSLEKGTNNISVVATDGVGNSNSKTRTVERTSPTNWSLYAGVAAIIAIILVGIAIWRRRAELREKDVNSIKRRDERGPFPLHSYRRIQLMFTIKRKNRSKIG